MKKIIILFFTLTYFIGFSQAKSGIAIYDLHIIMDDATKEIDKKYGYIQKAIDATKELDYILKFNINEAEFFQEKNDKLDNTSKYMANAISGVSKKNYINVDEKYILKEILTDGYLFKENEFLIKDTLITSWQISKENKMIGDYLCFKATTKKKIIKIVEDKEKEFFEEVSAWFAPSLPFSFGPSNYAGLPGLILELQERDFAFVIKKINLNAAVKINPLKSDKIISKTEYYELNRKRMEMLKEMSEQK